MIDLETKVVLADVESDSTPEDAERRQAGRAGKFLPGMPWKVGKVLSLAELDWAMKFRILR